MKPLSFAPTVIREAAPRDRTHRERRGIDPATRATLEGPRRAPRANVTFYTLRERRERDEVLEHVADRATAHPSPIVEQRHLRQDLSTAVMNTEPSLGIIEAARNGGATCSCPIRSGPITATSSPATYTVSGCDMIKRLPPRTSHDVHLGDARSLDHRDHAHTVDFRVGPARTEGRLPVRESAARQPASAASSQDADRAGRAPHGHEGPARCRQSAAFEMMCVHAAWLDEDVRVHVSTSCRVDTGEPRDEDLMIAHHGGGERVGIGWGLQATEKDRHFRFR